MVLLFRQELASHYPEEEIKAILYNLFGSLMGWSRATVHLKKSVLLTSEIEKRFMGSLERLAAGEPIQYIIGTTEFCGLILTVQPGVLIPRPETEELAVMVTRQNLPFRNQEISILDIGTGSGCLALALKKAFPTSQVTGTDISRIALSTARKNAENNLLEITLLENDVLQPSLIRFPDMFHLIVSNPPYIPEQERETMSRHVVEHEPESALFVPNENPLIFYDAIAGFAKTNLMPEGFVYVEIHEDLGEETVTLFRNNGFRSVELFRDYFGKNRFVRASFFI